MKRPGVAQAQNAIISEATSSTHMIKISAIATNLNGKRFLPRLIESLSGQAGVQAEIVIVDRESTDGSWDYLAGLPNIRALSEPAATGLAAGYALGAKAANNDLLFFCNEDMWFDRSCLRRLAAHIDLSKRIAAADPWQWTYDGSCWIHGGVRFETVSWHPNSPYPRRAFDFTVALDEGDRVPFACAGAFLIHRNVYEEIGGWDTSFVLESEDVDLFLRSWQRGWACVTVPSARVYHAVGAATSQKGRNGRANSDLRYVSGRSNLAAIAIKYFSLPQMLFSVPATIFAPLAVHTLKRDWNRMKLDYRAAKETLERLPALRSFRKRNKAWNVSHAGERFFTQPHMQVNGPRMGMVE